MIKKWIISILILNTSFNQTKSFVYYKCLPFSAKTAYPITEEILIKMKLDTKGYIRAKKLYGLKTRNNVLKILTKITTRQKIVLADYDLRFLIAVDNRQYFVNWDKKHLVLN